MKAAIERVLARHWYVLGEEVNSFEQELASWLGVKHVIGVGSGTDALALSLLAVGAQPGDEVITTDVTAVPTISAIQQVGTVPVLVDVDPSTGLVSADFIEAAITSRTKGIVPVHLYGRSCDMSAISDVAHRHGLWIVEDCAQSLGARHAGRVTGTFGVCGALSFYPTKNLGAYGDAGAVVCGEDQVAERLRALRNCGQRRRDELSLRGLNSRLDEMQAAILRVKLLYLGRYLASRSRVAARYRERLPRSILPRDAEPAEHVHHLFPVLVADRNRFRACLLEDGVESLVHYPTPVHRQPTVRQWPDGAFPSACSWTARVVSLPLHPNLTDEAQDRVIAAVTNALSHHL